MKFYDLTQRIVWDYDKGRSECPERWNDPLDYEMDCEEHYMLTRGVEVIEEDAIYLFGEYMSTVDNAFDLLEQWHGHLIGKIKKDDFKDFLDKKKVLWTPSYYDHVLGMWRFTDKKLWLSTYDGTPQEFYDLMMEEE